MMGKCIECKDIGVKPNGDHCEECVTDGFVDEMLASAEKSEQFWQEELDEPDIDITMDEDLSSAQVVVTGLKDPVQAAMEVHPEMAVAARAYEVDLHTPGRELQEMTKYFGQGSGLYLVDVNFKEARTEAFFLNEDAKKRIVKALKSKKGPKPLKKKFVAKKPVKKKKGGVMSATKQVIVIRRDLMMPRGKEIAQGAHASIAWLANRLSLVQDKGEDEILHDCCLSNYEYEWLAGENTKICVIVNSEAELMKIFDEAKKAGLTTHLIVDSGKTHFHGVPTKTCLAVGPNWSEDVDKVTGHLKLY